MRTARRRDFFRHLARRDRRAKILPEARPATAQGATDLGSADRAFDAEWKWLTAAELIWPGSVPRLVAQDRDAGLFVMEYLDPDRYPSWKSQLRDGILREETAVAVAERLVAIHAATAGRPEVAAAFDTGACFYAIRLEPYLVATGRVHTDLAPQLEALASATLATKRALVHGDVSPKNILVGPDGPVFIDSECALYGRPWCSVACRRRSSIPA